MSYSRVPFPPGVRNVMLKEGPLPCKGWMVGHHLCDTFDGKTWFVFNVEMQIVEAIFYSEPNVHGWSASEAHAKSYLNRYSAVNPFELDTIP